MCVRVRSCGIELGRQKRQGVRVRESCHTGCRRRQWGMRCSWQLGWSTAAIHGKPALRPARTHDGPAAWAGQAAPPITRKQTPLFAGAILTGDVVNVGLALLHAGHIVLQRAKEWAAGSEGRLLGGPRCRCTGCKHFGCRTSCGPANLALLRQRHCTTTQPNRHPPMNRGPGYEPTLRLANSSPL